ncbi:hypothetical protein XbrCFBP1976_19190 [Xanthomonas bromi]|uniref:Uncharacterized protein n=1 Tax=Xanthomonas bromi TaxID=56449 RepID=A0ABX5BP35_9XANT|nr:hypothetical protein XbrCFBP1976_19190 [Xanthomonas bromi]
MRTMFPLIDRRILLSECIGGKACPNHALKYGPQVLRFRSFRQMTDQCLILAADVLLRTNLSSPRVPALAPLAFGAMLRCIM